MRPRFLPKLQLSTRHSFPPTSQSYVLNSRTQTDLCLDSSMNQAFRTWSLTITSPPALLGEKFQSHGTIVHKVGEKFILNNVRRIHHTTAISAHPPSEPLRNELRLCVARKRSDVTIHGYWRAIMRPIKPHISYLLNVQPTLADRLCARKELSALDPITRDKLACMWPSAHMTTENFMLYQFMRHALIADNNYKEGYFQKTYDISSRYILGEKDIRSFLRDNFAPGVKYDSEFVNSELDSFVGARIKLGYGSFSPTTVQQIGILHDEADVLIDHPDGHHMPPVDIIVVAR